MTNPRDAKACQKLLQFDVLTTLSLLADIILAYLRSFIAVVTSEICEIPRNSLKIKIQTYRVQGHPRSSILVSTDQPICDFILVINFNKPISDVIWSDLNCWDLSRFVHRDVDVSKTLYTQHYDHIWSGMQMLCHVWHTGYKKEIEQLESVQRRTTKLVCSLRYVPYESRLRQMELLSLVYRRYRGDMIEIFKHLRGIYSVSSTELLPRAHASVLQGHDYKSTKRHCPVVTIRLKTKHTTPWFDS